LLNLEINSLISEPDDKLLIRKKLSWTVIICFTATTKFEKSGNSIVRYLLIFDKCQERMPWIYIRKHFLKGIPWQRIPRLRKLTLLM